MSSFNGDSGSGGASGGGRETSGRGDCGGEGGDGSAPGWRDYSDCANSLDKSNEAPKSEMPPPEAPKEVPPPEAPKEAPPPEAPKEVPPPEAPKEVPPPEAPKNEVHTPEAPKEAPPPEAPKEVPPPEAPKEVPPPEAPKEAPPPEAPKNEVHTPEAPKEVPPPEAPKEVPPPEAPKNEVHTPEALKNDSLPAGNNENNSLKNPYEDKPIFKHPDVIKVEDTLSKAKPDVFPPDAQNRSKPVPSNPDVIKVEEALSKAKPDVFPPIKYNFDLSKVSPHIGRADVAVTNTGFFIFGGPAVHVGPKSFPCEIEALLIVGSNQKHGGYAGLILEAGPSSSPISLTVGGEISASYSSNSGIHFHPPEYPLIFGNYARGAFGVGYVTSPHSWNESSVYVFFNPGFMSLGGGLDLNFRKSGQ